MKKLLVTLIFVLSIMNLAAQDTLVFSQKNSAMFSNKYFLYPQSKTFEHKYVTDDLQVWYGKGTYEIVKNKIILSFGDSEKEIKKVNQITKIYNQINNSDTLKIQFYNKDTIPPLGIIQYKEEIIYSDFDGIIKIPKNKFNAKETHSIRTFVLGAEVNIELENIDELDTIVLYAYELFIRYHFESNFKRVMNFRNNELSSKDFYYTTRKRKVIFALEK